MYGPYSRSAALNHCSTAPDSLLVAVGRRHGSAHTRLLSQAEGLLRLARARSPSCSPPLCSGLSRRPCLARHLMGGPPRGRPFHPMAEPGSFASEGRDPAWAEGPSDGGEAPAGRAAGGHGDSGSGGLPAGACGGREAVATRQGPGWPTLRGDPGPGPQAAEAAAGSRRRGRYLGPMSAGCRSPATRATR